MSIKHQVGRHLMGSHRLVDDPLQRLLPGRVRFATHQRLGSRRNVRQRIVDLVRKPISELFYGRSFGRLQFVVKCVKQALGSNRPTGQHRQIELAGKIGDRFDGQ